MYSNLTPEILRDAADSLCACDYYSVGHEFMYHAVVECGGLSALLEFEQFLLNDGVILRRKAPIYWDSYGTLPSSECRQAIRFMFLEFLALSLEAA